MKISPTCLFSLLSFVTSLVAAQEPAAERTAVFYQPHRERMTQFVKGITSDPAIGHSLSVLPELYAEYVRRVTKEPVPIEHEHLVEMGITDEYIRHFQLLTSLGCIALADELASAPDGPNRWGARSYHLVAARSLHEALLAPSAGKPVYTDCDIGGIVQIQAHNYCLALLKGEPVKFLDTRLRAELWKAAVETQGLYFSTDPDIDEEWVRLASRLTRFPDRDLLAESTRETFSQILQTSFDKDSACVVLASGYHAGRPSFEPLTVLLDEKSNSDLEEESEDEDTLHDWLARKPVLREAVLAALGTRKREEWVEWWDFLEGMDYPFITNSLGMELVGAQDTPEGIRSYHGVSGLARTEQERVREIWQTGRVLINHHKRVWENLGRPVPVMSQSEEPAFFEPQEAAAFAAWLTSYEVGKDWLNPLWSYRAVPVRGTKLHKLALIKIAK